MCSSDLSRAASGGATAPPGRAAYCGVLDQFQLRFRMLVRMAVRMPELSGQGRHTSIPASTTEVKIRPALVVLLTGTADAVFLRILHWGLFVCHVLC